MSPVRVLRSIVGCFLLFLSAILVTTAQTKKPNILVIFGDDIGQANISRYTHGVVGYVTQNIDRIGENGLPLQTTTRRTAATAKDDLCKQ